jgi:hypothetical protein
MSDVPFSGLPAADTLTGDEIVPLVQAGDTKRTTATDLAALAPGGGGDGGATGLYPSSGDPNDDPTVPSPPPDPRSLAFDRDSQGLNVWKWGSFETYADNFDRATLGTVGPNGNPYIGTPNWTITAGQLDTTVGGQHFLAVDTGMVNADASVKLIDNGIANHGLVFRYTDPDNWVGVIMNQDGNPPTVYVFVRTVGNYALPASWTGLAVPAGKILRATLTGNELAVWYDGVALGPPTTGSATVTGHVGVTRVGVMLYGVGHLDDFTFTVGGEAPSWRTTGKGLGVG